MTVTGHPGDERRVLDSRSEETFTSPLRLSLIIPAFNEAHRIEGTLREAIEFLASDFPRSEVILVDDGSTDDTLRIARAVAAAHPSLRVIANPHGGKATAVRTGLVEARGELIGFSDADLATPLRHLHELVAAIDDGCAIAIGSREGAGAVECRWWLQISSTLRPEKSSCPVSK